MIDMENMKIRSSLISYQLDDVIDTPPSPHINKQNGLKRHIQDLMKESVYGKIHIKFE